MKGILADGREVASTQVPIRVLMSAPVVKLPQPGSILKAGAGGLMTWEKTAITEEYELQVATNPGFSKPSIQLKQKQNFYLLQAPKAGSYYWRVRSLGGGRESAWSENGHFSVE